jgi:hypothetical protein
MHYTTAVCIYICKLLQLLLLHLVMLVLRVNAAHTDPTHAIYTISLNATHTAVLHSTALMK